MSLHELTTRSLLSWEVIQQQESGHDVGDLADEVASLATLSDDEADSRADKLWAALGQLERVPGWGYEEPEDSADIVAALPTDTAEAPARVGDFHDKVLGSWLGRIAGNQLGKPLENGNHWSRQHIRRYLEIAGSYPLTDYVPALDPVPDGFELRECWPTTTRGNIHGAERDDDLDYTILALHLLESCGSDFATDDVGRLWLDRIPFAQTFTAERVVYRNLVDGRAPADAAMYRNPYREWVGAQIRADAFGMVSPGAPRQAALWAMRDARLSHVTNGIYGEMWAAALVAAAFTAATAREALETSLLHIPPESRLAEVVTDMLASRDAGLTCDEAADAAETKLGHYGWVHTLPNAAVVALALLWGEEDFTTVIGLTVQAGLDTDSNGATAGAVAGALFGAAGIPQHWTAPLDDQVRSAIRGFDGVHVTDLARRTELLAASLH